MSGEKWELKSRPVLPLDLSTEVVLPFQTLSGRIFSSHWVFFRLCDLYNYGYCEASVGFSIIRNKDTADAVEQETALTDTRTK